MTDRSHVSTSDVCTGCGTSREACVALVKAGYVACCPDCSTLTVHERNALRGPSHEA